MVVNDAVSEAQYTALLKYPESQTSVTLPTPNELFEFQVRTLKEKGLDLSDEDANRLYCFIPSEPQIFVLIPSRPDDPLDLRGLMALVEVDGKTGKNNYLNRNDLTDVGTVPRTAHLLLDVDDGRKRLNTKPSVSLESIRQEGRLPYSAWYGLVHCIMFSCVLQHHNLDLCGSRYKSRGVPILCLREHLREVVPGLVSGWDDNAGPGWGAPSAGSIVGPS